MNKNIRPKNIKLLVLQSVEKEQTRIKQDTNN